MRGWVRNPGRLLLCVALLVAASTQARESFRSPDVGVIKVTALPPAAQTTLRLIKAGGPFPYARDGVYFQNREHMLPAKPRNYYREYTVPTTGSRDRGARRIIAGKNTEYYFTQDHYRSFERIEE